MQIDQAEAMRIAKLPSVRIYCDPDSVTPDNPNGIQVMSNMKGPNVDAIVVQLLGEGVTRWGKYIVAKSKVPVSATVVLPDGSPAPLPVVNGKAN